MEEEKKIKTGDTCPKCKKGKIALADGIAGQFTLDCEPYTNGVAERHGDVVSVNEAIVVVIHVCDKCGEVYSAHTEWRVSG